MANPGLQDFRAMARATMVSERPDLALDTDDVASMDADCAAIAGNFVIGEMAREVKGTFLDGATGDILTARAASRGVIRKEASQAIGEVTFTRSDTTDPDVIPIGTIAYTSVDDDGEEVRFATTAVGTRAAAVAAVTVAAEAEVAGKSGNVAIGTINRTPLAGNTVTNAAVFSGGNPEETDEELRERCRLKRLADREAVGNALEYHARTVAGVALVTVEEGATGIVNIYVSDSDGIANDALLDLVRDELEPHVAAGAAWNVLAGSVVEQDITLTVGVRAGSGASGLALQTEIIAAVTARIALLKNGETLTHDIIKQAALNVSPDFLSVTITVPTGSVIPTATQAIRAGSVTVS